LSNIAEIMVAQGDLKGALQVKSREVSRYENLADPRERAIAIGRIADILEMQGKFEDAVRMRKEEEIPIFERLGDDRERARSMGKVADGLYKLGNVEEALKIKREAEIPVYTKLGDTRAFAEAVRKIAAMLAERGENDQALRIRRNEELPAFERLGDDRERARTMSAIADALSQRGELEEARQIRRKINEIAGVARIFISYSRRDGAEFATQLRSRLVTENLSIWQDIIALEGGRDWWSMVQDALKSKALQHFILIVTPGALVPGIKAE
jgi:tetratricopeptide (TPR) repeat protein